MFRYLKFLFLLIQIDQKTVLSWFGINDSSEQNENLFYQDFEENHITSISSINFESPTNVSLNTIKLIVEGLWEKVQDGLTLTEIENILVFILFVRFIILAINYNILTSLRIILIGLVTSYLWYRHFIDLIAIYRSILLKLPYLHKLGLDALQLRSYHRQMVLTDLKLGEDVHWYNPVKLIYYAVVKGMTDVDPATGFRNYIDPVSMIIANLDDSTKSKVLPYYYKIYNQIIPKIIYLCGKLWRQISGVVMYTFVTRVGKRYCPYLLRWHWTFLLIIQIIEQVFISLIFRIYYFQSSVLIPQAQLYPSPDLLLQIDVLNVTVAGIVIMHMGLVLLGLLHAICGQYFYFPFFVENTELHVGKRPTSSIFSGGKTAWQNKKLKEKNIKQLFPQLWYGWFGKGTEQNGMLRWLNEKYFKFSRKIIKFFKRQSRR